jgi:NADPH:quinone reductase-like Zn-dependent oxidoreductase
MKALYVRQWGGTDAAVMEDVERPQPGQGEVLIRIKAVGVNPVDWAIRQGYMQEYVALPYLLGSDLAGDIEALGEGVEGFEVGTPVYCAKGAYGGAFAEYATAKVEWVAKKPSTLSYLEAAAVPHAAQTAWQALFQGGELKAGQRVLIHAAAGGVGHFAVQFAKIKGAYVIGTASENNEAFLRELGVDEYVNYNTTPFESVVKDVDVVLDAVGYDTAARSLQTLKSGGILVCIVTPPPFEDAAKSGVQAKYMGMQPNAAHLTEIAQLIDSGQVKVHIQQKFEFAKIHDAIKLIETHHVRGKLVATVAE